MQHCDDDLLALVALGEPPSAEQAEHLSGCPTCRSEVESLARVVTAARPALVAGPPITPPPQVWDAIAAATGVSVRPATLVPAARDPRDGDRHDGDRHHRGSGTAATVTQLRPPGRRSQWYRMPAAVAAATLVIGAVLGSGVTMLLDRDPAPVVQVVASTRLQPLPADPAARGEAVVVQDGDQRVLQVDVGALTGTDGFYEVWLIDADVKRMVPVGILVGPSGRFTLPDGLDLGQYPVVDISVEPLDGDPTHSGTSLLRGSIST